MTLSPKTVLACAAGFVYGVLIAASWDGDAQLARAKTYYCGYVRGMKFTADKVHYDIGPIPIQNCEQFDDLDKAAR